MTDPKRIREAFFANFESFEVTVAKGIAARNTDSIRTIVDVGTGSKTSQLSVSVGFSFLIFRDSDQSNQQFNKSHLYGAVRYLLCSDLEDHLVNAKNLSQISSIGKFVSQALVPYCSVDGLQTAFDLGLLKDFLVTKAAKEHLSR